MESEHTLELVLKQVESIIKESQKLTRVQQQELRTRYKVPTMLNKDNSIINIALKLVKESTK